MKEFVMDFRGIMKVGDYGRVVGSYMFSMYAKMIIHMNAWHFIVK